jgi:hypothetical protein
MQRAVQYAYSYKVSAKDQIQVEVSRRQPRTSGDAVGLVTAGPREFTGDWRITYTISRASAKRLYLLADKSLGQEIRITSATVPISSKSIVTPDEKTLPLPDELAQRYDLWSLNLDHKAAGAVAIIIHYERPRTLDSFEIPLVRPICDGQISEQLAIQASEELALTIDESQAKEIDAVDLPPLPVAASRVLAAYRLDAPTTATGPQAAVTLNTAVHENYGIPSALAISAQLTTYLDVRGGQRTEARFNIANAGKQFLTIRLPDGAELWSLRVGDKQAKPQQSARGDYQVALGRLGKPIAVKIVYEYRPGESGLDRLKLGGVELPGVEMNQMSWTVIPPPNYRISEQETRMQTSDLIRPAPAYTHLRNFLSSAGISLFQPLGRTRQYQYAASRSESATVDRSGVRYGLGAGGAAPPPTARPAPQAQQEESDPVAQKARGVRLVHEGRFTLPVDLVPTPSAGPQVKFTGLGATELIISLTNRPRQTSWWALGFMLIAAAGVVLAKEPVKVKTILVIAVLSTASFLAVWAPSATSFANGSFTAGMCLVLLYVLIWLVRRSWERLFSPGAANGASARIVLLAAFILCLGHPARATEVQKKDSTPPPPGVIIPYDGQPTTAEKSDKILVPYTRFVELWNQAHPEDTIDRPRPGTRISLSDVRYKVTVKQEQLNLLLTADVGTYGEGWVVLGLPISGLAVTKATLDGEVAKLQAGPKGMVLMVPGGTSGQLELHAVTKPEYLGRRGSAGFSLPPLPGAVMKVVLSEEDLELEVDQIEATPAKRTVNGSVEYTFGLGMTRKLALRWLPKAGGGAADRTLSANSEHDVYAFHWAIVGVSKITYSFSSGDHSRFALLVPKGTMLTELKGTNIRDFRDVGEKTIENKVFKLIEVRLHRAAQERYELTARWLSPHAGGGDLSGGDAAAATGVGADTEEPTELSLVRAGDVSRESGSVTLHSAGGMSAKVAEVSGGRRTDLAVDKEPQSAELTADRARAVAKYYWPYRPFALFAQLSRLEVSPKVNLNQLVRINTDRVELLVQANLKAEQGKLFGASFALPEGYELLSAVGPAVENFYERSSDKGRFLHIKFNRGWRETEVALVLVRRDVRLESFEVPAIIYLDHEGRPLARQKGRLAVQVAASLEAETAASENLKSISPQTLKDWLDARQINSAQFAYRYETANPSLQLTIRRLPTAMRVEAFAGLVVRPAAAVYTYRLRYNITGSPVDRLSFRLPDEYAPLINVESQAMRSVTQSDAGNGQTRWTVTLVNEATGIVDIAVNFALPIDDTPELQIPPLQTEDQLSYRATVAVQNMSRHDINVKDSANLSDLAVSEQQKMMPREMRESLQYVFQSFDDDWSLSLELKPAKIAIRIQAVVDLLELTTVIDRGGRCRYEAKVALQNRSEQFLRVKMPKGLRLWSASVASQPVKPVIAADSPEAEVLIPLVKTSPGGLPYDVYLYFADDGAKPLVVPLNGITRLKPPGIRIVGIPVMQMVWSLRLPGGYRYMRPGGNMSPVAGTVEVLSLGIEAKLEQLRRLERTYRDVAGSFVQRQQIAKQNWDVFNTKLGREIEQAQSYLDANQDEVGEEKYRRLRTKLGGQRQLQGALMGSNTAFVRRQQEQARNDLNAFLNVDASNVGVSEVVRNEVLLEKPGFLSKSEAQQIARLQKELEVSQQKLKRLEAKREKSDIADEAQEQNLAKTSGKKAGDLIVESIDQDAEMHERLDQIARETTMQIDRQQAQIKGQLEELRDNRLQRHFLEDSKKVLALRSQARRQSQPQGQGARDSNLSESENGYARPGGRERFEAAQPMGQTAARVPQLRVVRGAASGPAPPGAGKPYEPGSAAGDMQLYTATGVYSLPVTLPEGEVRLDFARPSGEAELSLWAVPLSTIRNLYGTLTVIVGLLVAGALVKIWPRPQTKRPTSAKRVIGYALLFVALTLTLGPLGLLISLFVILVCEARRGVFVRPVIGGAEG